MTRREVERHKFRQALVSGLVLSAVAHLALLGLGAFEVPGWETTEPDREREARAEEWKAESLEVVTLRPRPDRSASRPGDGARSARRPPETPAVSAAPTPEVRPASAPSVAPGRVNVPAVAIAVSREEANEADERLSASDLAALFPGRSETPKPTSRAARAASGEPRSIGDQFRGPRGTQRAGARGGGCVVRPGTAINRRFPEGITIGGG